MRPHYETADDLKREEEALVDWLRVIGWSHYSYHKLDENKYRADFGIFDETGKMILVVEVKCWTENIRRYFFISLSKWMAMLRYHEIGVPPYILLATPDRKLRWVQVGHWVGAVGWDGRKDRGDDKDMEPVVRIMENEFDFSADRNILN